MSLTMKMVTIDCEDPQRLVAFWTRALGASVVVDYTEFVILGVEGSPALGLQRVDEPRAGKNRVHFDLVADDPAAEVRRLVELGATQLAEHSVPGLAWTVLADPEGNEFCVSEKHE
ncbi:VOC family protein [Streptoalloteichus hindustanus]|uniref:VOC domain-containing protein n=1 Tax=Streptoalloteichus hindustanus TaxID=2017 RepID=A0A1M5B0Z8_STRHI|nr:VOC family protein [Streptoalloteichus hindustanus]SHF36129.1 hypothetical protein SAMN05444320_103347 [Streptoalloteichus hindustanus]